MLLLDDLFKGMIYTLKHELIPDLSSSYAKGQAFGLIYILSNLSVRVENMSQYLMEENNDLKESLSNVIEIVEADQYSFKGETWVDLIQRIRNHLKRECPPFYRDLMDKNNGLKDLLVDVIEALEANKQDFQKETLVELRQRIRNHLRKQLNRELLIEKSLRFKEIMGE